MTPSSVYTAELVEAIKVALNTNILRVTIKPLARLPPSPREGEKKQKKYSTPAKKKDTHNSSSTPQPLSARVRVTEGKMERVESMGLSEKPPITTSVDRKEPPEWFAEHMGKVSGCTCPSRCLVTAPSKLYHCVFSNVCGTMQHQRLHLSQTL